MLSPAQACKSVIVVQDAFTRYFETPLLASFIELASRIGFKVFVAPYSPNGKPLHVQGFLAAFNKAAVRNAGQLQALSDSGVRLVGLDPAMTLVYRQEYSRVPGLTKVPTVELPQEWLLGCVTEGPASKVSGTFRLLAHCTEKTNVPASSKQWVEVFRRMNLELIVEATGCCGMSGTYGHESRNQETSRVIFGQSWKRKLAEDMPGEALCTGYSCRSQVKRLSNKALRHPLEVLLELYRNV